MKDNPDLILIHCTRRDGASTAKRAVVEPDLIQQLCDGLVAQENIREVRIYRIANAEVFYHHKSYAEDFDPKRLEAEIVRLMGEMKK